MKTAMGTPALLASPMMVTALSPSWGMMRMPSTFWLMQSLICSSCLLASWLALRSITWMPLSFRALTMAACPATQNSVSRSW